jgi:Family of unknown function (DUF5675)
MRTATIQRFDTGDQGTFGHLTTDDGFTCETGELPYRDNTPNFSCIPAGEYECEMLYSQHFKRDVYRLKNVPNRTDVEIHNGNYCGDTTKGYKSDVLGCIILGHDVITMFNQAAVSNSKYTLDNFMTHMGGDNFTLTIKDKE